MMNRRTIKTEDKPRCPLCNTEFDSGFMYDVDGYEEGPTECWCDSCEEAITIITSISFSFETREGHEDS